MPLSSGTRLGPYEIVAPLGAGGMGEVYRARDTRLGREVAIKVLPADVASHADRLARLEREAQTVAALNHPNIVTLHSIEESNGTRFLTMELVQGRTLDELVVPGGLPVARVLELAIPLADALVAAHERGVVHRDLKPSNLMVTREGRLKVLDFGLAKLDADSSPLDATQAATMATPISTVGQIVGTIPYMSPEQLRGGAVDARTDLFSVGILLYELATGRRPFQGATAAEMTSAILRDAPEPVQRLRADLPADLARIIGRCLEKDPERRVQTAKDVRNELDTIRRETAPGSDSMLASRPNAAPVAAAAAPSIAVLPFANRSREQEDEYFCDGLADELIGVLVKVRGLRVAARTSSATFKGKTVTIAESGRALNVATVLEGSVRKSGNRVRITVQLVKVEDETPLWSETYDRTLDDIFAVQDDIAQAVVKELRTTLLGAAADSATSGEAKAEVAAAARGRGQNAEAHRLYLQAKYYIERFNQPDTLKGQAFLREALALDPHHAPSWVQMARTYWMGAAYGWLNVAEGAALAHEALNRALALEPDLVEAHVSMSQVKRSFEWDWRGAEISARRALELAPDDSGALLACASLAQVATRFAEAETLICRAVAVDPLRARLHSELGGLYRHTHRLAEAEQAYRKALDLSPRLIGVQTLLSVCVAGQGRDAEALSEVSHEHAEWSRLTGLTYIHWVAGRKAESDEALAELESRHAEDSAFQIALLHAVRGEADAAFQWLDRGFEQRDAGMAFVRCEPSFAGLHGDPRWVGVLTKMGMLEA